MAAGRGLWAQAAGNTAEPQGQGRQATVPLPPPTAAPAAQRSQRAGSSADLVIVAVDKRAEHVDIRNNGSAAVDLAGWALHSEKDNQNCSLGGSIAPGQTLRVYAMTGEGGFNCGFGGNIWNNSEPDAAVLWAPGVVEVSRY